MTKDDAIKLKGGVPQLADFFGISQSAIYQWPEEKIPERRELKLILWEKENRKSSEEPK